jgi:beta-N-acetylhexosaminidase
MLAHQAGLQAWIPFWKNTMEGDHSSPLIYHKAESDDFPYRVADSLYMRAAYKDSMTKWIYNSELGQSGKYVYSDLGPILMKAVIEQQTSTTIDQLLNERFYKPLGLSNTVFKPRDHFPLKRIIPTENDTAFRKQLVQGDVHDPAAAMFGGVSGNAGLFCNANDLAVIMQLLLNRGIYGGKQFLKQTTVNYFTKQQFPGNRRGLLFDKPEPDLAKASPVDRRASLKTFGHQGFTGTCVWVDPQHSLIYIFLSNRVNPDVSNEKLVKMSVRTEIQRVIYDAIEKGK